MGKKKEILLSDGGAAIAAHMEVAGEGRDVCSYS